MSDEPHSQCYLCGRYDELLRSKVARPAPSSRSNARLCPPAESRAAVSRLRTDCADAAMRFHEQGMLGCVHTPASLIKISEMFDHALEKSKADELNPSGPFPELSTDDRTNTCLFQIRVCLTKHTIDHENVCEAAKVAYESAVSRLPTCSTTSPSLRSIEARMWDAEALPG